MAKKALKTVDDDTDGMNEPLRVVYGRAKAILEEVDSKNIMARWMLGKEIDKVMSDERTYGVGGAEKLAESLCIDAQELYRYRNFSLKYEKPTLVELLKRKTENGRSLTWSHFEHLTRIDNDKSRNKLTEQVLAQNMNVRELAAAIQKKYGNRSNNPGGRPRIGPKSAEAALALITKHAASDSMVFAVVNDYMLKVKAEPASYANQKFLTELTEAKSQTSVIANAASEVLEALTLVEATVANAMRKAKNQAAMDGKSDKATVRAAAKKTIEAISADKKPLQKKPLQKKLPPLRPKKPVAA